MKRGPLLTNQEIATRVNHALSLGVRTKRTDYSRFATGKSFYPSGSTVVSRFGSWIKALEAARAVKAQTAEPVAAEPVVPTILVPTQLDLTEDDHSLKQHASALCIQAYGYRVHLKAKLRERLDADEWTAVKHYVETVKREQYAGAVSAMLKREGPGSGGKTATAYAKIAQREAEIHQLQLQVKDLQDKDANRELRSEVAMLKAQLEQSRAGGGALEAMRERDRAAERAQRLEAKMDRDQLNHTDAWMAEELARPSNRERYILLGHFRRRLHERFGIHLSYAETVELMERIRPLKIGGYTHRRTPVKTLVMDQHEIYVLLTPDTEGRLTPTTAYNLAMYQNAKSEF